jgi:DNA mismatch repair protein MutS2
MSRGAPVECIDVRFSPGDRVHLSGLGTGVVRDVRGADRYALDIKGRLVVAHERDLQPADERTARATPAAHDKGTGTATTATGGRSASLDLHGKSTVEALEIVESFLNDALVGGLAEVTIIHGRGGGRIKTAVHGYLKRLAGVASYRLDPHNVGVTIVTFR